MSLNPSSPEKNGGYRLILNRFFTWNLSSDPVLQGWLDRLAILTEIEPDNDGRCPRLIFTGKECRNRNKLDELPTYDFRTMRIWQQASGDLITEVDNKEVPDAETINMWNAMFPIYLKAAEHGGLAIHAGLVELDGRGILLAGAGNAGKSTCCRRLPRNWKVLSDDLSLIVWDKEIGYRAHPFPTWSEYLWGRASGRSWNVKYSVPLQAVLFLEKSSGNEIIPVDSKSKAAIWTNGGAVQIYRWFWQMLAGEKRRTMAGMVFENACEIARVIPVYTLRLSLTGRFWELIEKECF